MVTRPIASSRAIRSSFFRTCFSLLCMAALALPATVATAQDPEAPVAVDEVSMDDFPESDTPTEDEMLEAEEAEVAEEQTGRRGVETITVTARKREDDLQEVPIPMTAFSGQMLDIQRIENTLDLQFNVPNLLFGKTNFTGSNLQIRGIGSAVISSSGEPAVGIHLNEVPLTTSRIFEQEFYDIERIEVLRGPQGTLFGRNATGGAFNVYTRKPTDEYEATGEVSAGNYALARVKGAVNVPLSDSLRTRVAGMYLHRNGYIDNIYTDNDIDDRNLYGVRGSIGWDITEKLTSNAMVSWFSESDKRSRIGKQLCDKDTRQGVFSIGCTDQPPGFEGVASYATLGGILENYTLPLFGLPAMYPPGYNFLPDWVPSPPAPNPPGFTYSNPPDALGFNPDDFREHAARVDPSYEANELFVTLDLNWDEDFGSFKALVGYQKTEIETVQDYAMNIPTIAWDPTSVATLAFAGLTGCNTGTDPGLELPSFGCIDRTAALDNSDASSEQISGEFRFTSDFDGPFNFTAGTIYTYFSAETDYRVFFTGAEIISALSGLPQETSYYSNETSPAITNSFGLFAEGDYELFESWTLTGGIRYTNDRKSVRSRVSLLDPALPDFEKQEESWNEVTGRAIIQKDFDFDFADQSNAFVSYSRGYKPGGFNPPAATQFEGTPETFEPEYINAVEFGSKNRFFDNTLQANTSVFFYDYDGYQISKIVNRTAVNENVDAFVWGVEAELVYEVIEDLLVSLNFAYLGSKIRGGESIDPADPAAERDDPITGDYDVIKRLDNAANILCPRSAPGAVGSCRLDLAEPLPVAVPGGLGYENPDGTLRDPYVEGFAKQLDGKELPNAPNFNINIGASYSFNLIVPGQFTPRISWYWQSDMYGRMFNSERDKIDSWSQANAGLRWNDDDNRVWVDFWIQNFTNNNDITTMYLTDASSGNFTNVFLLEPLTVGGTIGFSF